MSKPAFQVVVVREQANGQSTTIHVVDRLSKDHQIAYMYTALIGYDATCALSQGDRALKFLSPIDVEPEPVVKETNARTYFYGGD